MRPAATSRIGNLFPRAALWARGLPGLAFFVWWRRREVRERLCDRSRGGAPLCFGAPVLLVYIVWYLVAMLLIWSFSNNDPINTRYLAPIYGHAMVLTAMR